MPSENPLFHPASAMHPDLTLRNWQKFAGTNGGYFFRPVTPHTFRPSCIMPVLCIHQLQKVGGNRDARSMEVYTRVLALDVAATLPVSFSGEGT